MHGYLCLPPKSASTQHVATRPLLQFRCVESQRANSAADNRQTT